ATDCWCSGDRERADDRERIRQRDGYRRLQSTAAEGDRSIAQRRVLVHNQRARGERCPALVVVGAAAQDLQNAAVAAVFVETASAGQHIVRAAESRLRPVVDRQDRTVLKRVGTGKREVIFPANLRGGVDGHDIAEGERAARAQRAACQV